MADVPAFQSDLVQQGIAYGSGHIAASLPSSCHNERNIRKGQDLLFGRNHIDKANRHGHNQAGTDFSFFYQLIKAD